MLFSYLQTTFSQLCRPRSNRRYDRKMYSSLLRHPQSFKSFKTASHATEHVQNLHQDYVPEDRNGTTPYNNQTATTKETALSRTPIENGNFRPRMSSETSQITILTTLSKSISTDGKNESHRQHAPIGRSISSLQRHRFKGRYQGRNYLNINRHGILSYGMFKLFSKQNAPNKSRFSRHGSVESAHSTNTISNSSLQDMDESEFNSSELAQYMEEINNGLA